MDTFLKLVFDFERAELQNDIRWFKAHYNCNKNMCILDKIIQFTPFKYNNFLTWKDVRVLIDSTQKHHCIMNKGVDTIQL